MKLLAIDTSTAVAGAALLVDGTLTAEANLCGGMTHSQRLMDLVDRCMGWAGVAPEDLDAVAVVSGPGSFTGVRIGVATAKGMAQALGIPVVAVGTLEVLAASCPVAPGIDAGGRMQYGSAMEGRMQYGPTAGGVIAPLLDARRGQVYCAAYETEIDGQGVALPRQVLPPAAMALADFLVLPAIAAAPRVVLCGDGVAPNLALIRQTLGDRAVLLPEHLRLQRAGAVAALAWRAWLAGRTQDGATLQPVYLRKPQAEQAREAQAQEAQI